MKILALAAATVVAGLSTSVSAQTYYDRSYEPYRDNRAYYADRDARVVDSRPQECYNPRAGHFEMVRPGEAQGDLDFGNCRGVGYRDDRAYREERRDWREAQREECWNPRARHYEEVRRGEQQDDLDYGRCRILRG
jgi:hypothetical protein